MTSIIFGIACIYFSQSILRLPKEHLQKELEHLTGRSHGEGYCRMIRLLFLGLGILGAAMILMRFFD